MSTVLIIQKSADLLSALTRKNICVSIVPHLYMTSMKWIGEEFQLMFIKLKFPTLFCMEI